MVTIGTLQWTVTVEKAEEAKEQVKDVAENVEDTKEQMEQADETTKGLKEKFKGFNEKTKTAKERFKNLTEEAGYAGAAFGLAAGATQEVTERIGEVSPEQTNALSESAERAKESLADTRSVTTKLANRFGNLEDVQEKAGEGMDRVGAKAGFLRNALMFLGGTIATIIGYLTSLTALLAGGAIIAALVALAYAWMNNLGNIRDATKSFIAKVREALGNLSLEAIKKRISEFVETIRGILDSINFSAIAERIRQFAGGVREALASINFDPVRESARKFASAVRNAFSGFDFSAVESAFQGLWEIVKPILGGLAAGVVSVGSALWDSVSEMGSALVEMNDRFGTLAHIQSRLAELASAIGDRISFIIEKVIQIGEAFATGFKESGVSLKDFHVIITSFVDGVVDGLQLFWSVSQPIIGAFADALAFAARIAGRALGEIIQWVSKLEQRFGLFSTLIKWVTAFVAAFAAVKTVIAIATALWSALGTLGSVVGSVLGVFGPLIKVIGFLTPSLSTLISAAGTLVSVLGSVASAVGFVISLLEPFSTIILALIVTAAALYAAWETNFLGIRDITQDAIEGVKGVIDSGISFVVGVYKPFLERLSALTSMHFSAIKEEIGETVTHWQNVFNDAWSIITSIFQNALTAITNAIDRAWGYIGPIWDALVSHVIRLTTRLRDFLIPVWNTIASRIISVAQNIHDFLIPIWSAITDYLGFVWETMKATVLTAVDAILTGIRVFLNVLQGDWKEAWSAIEGFVDRTLSRIQSLISDAKEGIGNAIDGVINAIKAPFEWLYNTLVGESLVPDMLADIAEAIRGAVDMISSAVQAVISAILGPFKAIAGAAGGASDALGSLAGQAMDSVSNAISGTTGAVQGAAENVAGTVANTLGGVASSATAMGESIANNVAVGIQNNTAHVQSAIENAATSVANYLPSSPAEKGPLSNIDQTGEGLVKTVAEGIEQERQRLEQATASAAGTARRGLVGGAAGGEGGRRRAGGLGSDVPTERVTRRAPVRRAGTRGEGDGGPRKIEVHVGGVEIGDQRLDIRSMGRTQLRSLAEEIAEVLGDEVQSTIT